MLRLAITGGIACGKSVVAAMLVERGVPVCSTDALARDVTGVGEPAYYAVVKAFGSAVVSTDGRLDRRALGDLVFADERRRAVLNAIVHPEVMRRASEWMAAERERKRWAVGVEVPLLFECGFEYGWDAVLCVWAPLERQRALLKLRGLDDEAIRLRLAAQWPTDEKARLANIVVMNIGSTDVLAMQVDDLLGRMAPDRSGIELS